MSNLYKRHPARASMGHATGSAVGTAAGAAVVALVVAPPLWFIVAAPTVCAIAGSLLGDYLGYRWDDPFGEVSFGSAALYGAVVSGTLFTVLCFLALGQLAAHLDRLAQNLSGIAALVGFLSALSRNLISDIRSAAARG